jgi:hypothetical protein
MRPGRRRFIAEAAAVPAIVHAAGETDAFGRRRTIPDAIGLSRSVSIRSQ